MSHPRIKRTDTDVLRHQRHVARKIKQRELAFVSAAIDLETGKVICLGVSGEAVAKELERRGLSDSGTWKIEDMQVLV